MTAEDQTKSTHKEPQEAHNGASLAFGMAQDTFFVMPIEHLNQPCVACSRTVEPTTCAPPSERENSGFS
ncbi:MAG: hypothetical protein DWC07_03145, partial [Candidatus Poseidoniales archaeon]